MFRRRPSLKQAESKGAPSWMVTFSDLMTLILVFFLLLFSASNIDMEKLMVISDSFQQRQVFEFMPSPVPFEHLPKVEQEEKEVLGHDEESDEESDDTPPVMTLDDVLSEIQHFLTEHDLEYAVSATKERSGVVLVLQDSILFRSGEADIVQEGEELLTKIGQLLSKVPHVIKVEGHTDNVPISNMKYPSNWELSTARASRVIRFFVDEHELDAARFVAVGYGEYQPIVTNDTEEGRQKNRRVVLVISEEFES